MKTATWRRMCRGLLTVAAATVLGIGLSACPPLTPGEGEGEGEAYDEGFDDGFANDDEYWQGYVDSMDTVNGGTIFYSGHLIPDPDDNSYEDGYNDGIWYAYNDGYFVAYDFAFVIGWSEGYDVAFHSDWQQFLLADDHTEWLDGGFSDGYNDGFSEGRIFGAYDYDAGLSFDWLDALLDYKDGTDLYLDEVDLGTGQDGPVVLYEYGQNPHDLVKGVKSVGHTREPRAIADPSIRDAARTVASAKQDEPPLIYRLPIIESEREFLDQIPDYSPRSDRLLEVSGTWLERIEAYLDTLPEGRKAGHPVRAGK